MHNTFYYKITVAFEHSFIYYILNIILILDDPFNVHFYT